MDNNFEYRVYLKSLSKQFPTIADAATEIINLQAILSLPKGTEHFLTDIHGEYEQFNHVLKNGSGSVRRKIDEEFGNTLSVKDKRSLATLIYYPQEKLELVCQEEEDQDVLEDWFKITIHRLVQMTQFQPTLPVAYCRVPNIPAPRCARRCPTIFPMSSKS